MKRGAIFVALVFCLFFQVLSSVKKVGSSNELKELEINCHPDYSIIVEFPKDVNIQTVIFSSGTKKWVVDYDLNLLWAQPDNIESSVCIFTVSTDLYKDIQLKLRVERESSKLIHSIVLQESAFILKNAEPKVKKTAVQLNVVEKKKAEKPEVKNIALEEKKIKEIVEEPETKQVQQILEKQLSQKDQLRKPVKREKNKAAELKIGEGFNVVKAEEEKKKKFKYDSFFSFSGGTQSFQDSSFFLEGEIIFATRSKSGLFLQGAGKTSINSFLKDYGFSVGAGYEPEDGKLGFFLFVDMLVHKFGDEFNATTHFQIRPSSRFRLNDNIHVAGFVAVPIGSWQFTGVEVPGKPGIGYYNKSLLHAGLDLQLFMKKLYFDVRGLIAEGSAFSIDLRSGYELIRNIFVTLNYNYSSAGDYYYIEGINNSNRIALGVTLNMKNFKSREKDRIIFRPDYPMVVTAEKEIEEGDEGSVSISLAGTPTSGEAPVQVSFTAVPKGFTGKVDYTWKLTPSYQDETTTPNTTYTYIKEGTYVVTVTGVDEEGKSATSNKVEIVVSPPVDGILNRYKIKATCSSGGYIQPEGEVEASEGSSVNITFEGDEGWGVTKVTVDGKEQESKSSPWVFENINADHEIHVEFAEGAIPEYTIESSVTSGSGTITPDGSTAIKEGESQEYIITPTDGWSTSKVLVDGQSVGVPEKYTFENISDNHEITCEFSENPPPVYVVESSSASNGAISPEGNTKVVQGDNVTFNLTPDDGYKIDTLKVDGSTVNPNGDNSHTLYSIQKNMTIHVTWVKITYTVTTQVLSGDGTITGSATVEWGEDFVVSANPSESHEVDELIVNGASVGKVSEITLNKIKSNQTVNVRFAIKTFDIITEVLEGNGVITSSRTVEYGSDLKIAATPAESHLVEELILDSGSLGTVSEHELTNICEDHTVQVKFKWKTYTVTTSVESGEGTITESATVNWGTDFTVEMTPDESSDISDVVVNGSSVGAAEDYELTNIKIDQTVSVTFAKKTFTVTATVKNDRWGSLSPAGVTTVEYGDSLTVTFNPDQHKQTINYWVNGNLRGGEGSIQHTWASIKNNKTIEVEFDWIYYDVEVRLVREGGYNPDATLDPGEGTYTYKSGETLTFNCNPAIHSEVQDIYINGNRKSGAETYKIFNIDRDSIVEFVIRRKEVPVGFTLPVGGCYSGTVSSNYGQTHSGGGYTEFNVPYGYSITLYFDTPGTKPAGVSHYDLYTETGGSISLPSQHAISNVTNNISLRIKCVMEDGSIEE